MKVTLVVQRGDELLCRDVERAAVPEPGQAFTIVNEGETAELASTVEAVTAPKKGPPLVYGGPWPHEPEDRRLKRHGFRACRAAEREQIEAELAKGPA